MNTVPDPRLLNDPRRTERVGARLAERLADHRPTLVVCWDDSDDVVLAHVVARELGIELRLANEVEGIVALERPLPDGAVVALVAESLASRTAIGGLAGVVAHGGARVAAVATGGDAAEVADTGAATATVITAGDA